MNVNTDIQHEIAKQIMAHQVVEIDTRLGYRRGIPPIIVPSYIIYICLFLSTYIVAYYSIDEMRVIHLSIGMLCVTLVLDVIFWSRVRSIAAVTLLRSNTGLADIVLNASKYMKLTANTDSTVRK